MAGFRYIEVDGSVEREDVEVVKGVSVYDQTSSCETTVLVMFQNVRTKES